MMFNLFEMDGPFYRAMAIIADFMIVNFLFIITALPIFTLGAALSALYGVLLNYDVNREENIFVCYTRTFKQNWKQSTVMNLLILLISSVLITNIMLYPIYQGVFKPLVNSALIIISIIIFLFSTLIYPYFAKFHDSMRNASKNVLKMIADNIFRTLSIACISVVPIGIMLVSAELLLLGLYFFLFIGFSLVGYMNARLLNQIFNKYLNHSQ